MTLDARTTMFGSRSTNHAALPSRRARVSLALLTIAGVVILSSLGVWQIERRLWKLDLIDRVERRVRASPVTAPGSTLWSHVNAKDDAYRHVMISGHFLDVAPALALAVTERGGGYWVMAPITTDEGAVVYINRGFVPLDRSQWPNLAASPGRITVTGLLRMSEPKGAFLRHNDPAADRWYSRDVASIGRSHGLHKVAPYFIDADRAATNPLEFPIGGLTVVAFPNNHLAYALTWFALAAMLACWWIKAEWQQRGWRSPLKQALCPNDILS